MNKSRTFCPYCNEELENPLASARGSHLHCVRKSQGESIEK